MVTTGTWIFLGVTFVSSLALHGLMSVAGMPNTGVLPYVVGIAAGFIGYGARLLYERRQTSRV